MFFFLLSFLLANPKEIEENIIENTRNWKNTTKHKQFKEIIGKDFFKNNRLKAKSGHNPNELNGKEGAEEESHKVQDKQNTILKDKNYFPKYYPNAIDRNGTIFCKEGFIGDNPIQSRGCWKCVSKCHPLASCQYPGFCNCPPGYEGNGISSCIIPTPYPFEYGKIEDKGHGKVFINISFTGVSEVFNATEIFCKFNDDIVRSNNFTHEYAIFEYNKRITSGTIISLSYNNKDWGETLVVSSSIQTYIFYGFALIAGIIIGISAFIMLLTTKPGPTAKREEMKPLKNDINREGDFDEEAHV